MMFLQYAAMGAILPILSLYLRDVLGFSGTQIGMIMAMPAVAACISPVVGAFMADKVMSTERFLALCHLAAGVLMLLFWRQSGFWAVLVVYLGYMLAMQPTQGLTNAVAFHHLPTERTRFAGIRVWGTLGWMVVGALFGYLWLGRGSAAEGSRLADALMLAALLSLSMSAYSFSLPRANADQRKRLSIIPNEAFAVLRDPSMLMIMVLNFLMFVALQHYFIGAGPYLRYIGFEPRYLMPSMAFGQLVEVFSMLALVVVSRRLPIKGVLLLGALSEVGRFSFFTFGGTWWTALAGIGCHGLSIAFFMTASIIYVDNRCSPAARSGVHQLLTIVTFGIAVFVGSQMAGFTLDTFSGPGRVVDYRWYWAVPLGIVVLALVVLVVLFPGEPHQKGRDDIVRSMPGSERA